MLVRLLIVGAVAALVPATLSAQGVWGISLHKHTTPSKSRRRQ